MAAMKVSIQEAISALERLAPPRMQEAWDNSGLQVGNPEASLTGVVVALDLDEPALDLAATEGANLIITHHPLFFEGIKKIDPRLWRGRVLSWLIREEIAVYSAHTSLDSAPNGINQFLAQKMGLTGVRLLGETGREAYYKLVVFTPVDYVEDVRAAICSRGAGHIGKYSDCSFRSPGKGTFLPREGTNPFIGEQGRLEEVEEYRLETIVPENILQAVLEAMLKAHPYEEPAYDIYPLAKSGLAYSYGRMGELPRVETLSSLAGKVKKILELDHVRFCGPADKQINRVAVVSGAGAGMAGEARRQGCDVLVTGDIKYHEAREALQDGLYMLDAGHDGLEKAAVELICSHLKKEAGERDWGIKIIPSQVPMIFRSL